MGSGRRERGLETAGDWISQEHYQIDRPHGKGPGRVLILSQDRSLEGWSFHQQAQQHGIRVVHSVKDIDKGGLRSLTHSLYGIQVTSPDAHIINAERVQKLSSHL